MNENTRNVIYADTLLPLARIQNSKYLIILIKYMELNKFGLRQISRQSGIVSQYWRQPALNHLFFKVLTLCIILNLVTLDFSGSKILRFRV